MDDLELWGGPECTVNRVGDRFADQFRATGHDDRLDDIDRFAGLGLRAIRYPLLWERVAPDDPGTRDWGWYDARMHRLRAHGIRVIAGLVHHGSGPRYTSLVDPGFAPGLADHAAAAAERYPWINDWTPVNEPLTTARFAALYGHWYPHARDEGSFWQALLNQIDATRLAMRAIRRTIPGARLIQTEDLGRTYATSAVREQAAFDNLRRWMSWDLLTGRVTPDHGLWRRLCRFGLEDRLRAIADDPCPPAIVGVNHYLTSDRFLDHRVRRYPDCAQGGNDRQRFADTAAIRVLQPPPPGLEGVLREAWDRYRLPLAVTELHNGCTREEQMRWAAHGWRVATALRRDGVDVRAVTSWALLGSQGWHTLLTAPGRYEAGAWDVTAGTPRATAMVPLLRELGRTEPSHPVMQGSGWWQRPVRLLHPPAPRPAPMREQLRAPDWTGTAPARPILLLGATGTLGRALAAACRHRDLAHLLTARDTVELADPRSIARTLDRHRPWCVINAAGWVRVDDAEADEPGCTAVNLTGAAALARACADRGIATVSFSSDLVFDGTRSDPYVEQDAPAPLNAYGRSKAALERALAALAGTHLVVRTAAFFSPHDPHNFAMHAVGALAAGRRLPAADDWIVTPSYVPDLCDAVLDLAIDGEAGIWHLANGPGLSWAAFAHRLADACGLDAGLIDPVPGASLGLPAPRPPQAALASTRGQSMMPLDQAIDRFAVTMRDRLPGLRAAA